MNEQSKVKSKFPPIECFINRDSHYPTIWSIVERLKKDRDNPCLKICSVLSLSMKSTGCWCNSQVKVWSIKMKCDMKFYCKNRKHYLFAPFKRSSLFSGITVASLTWLPMTTSEFFRRLEIMNRMTLHKHIKSILRNYQFQCDMKCYCKNRNLIVENTKWVDLGV